ncbi:hypothetical protein [Mesorhizobium sp. A623]
MVQRKKEKAPAAGIRIDGANRRDLNKQRVAGRMAGVVKPPRTSTQSEASQRARQNADDQSRRQTAKLRREDGGKEGARLSKVSVKISTDRTARRTIRCRPGTFEWRYGRNKQNALFHAGNQFATLWERARASLWPVPPTSFVERRQAMPRGSATVA